MNIKSSPLSKYSITVHISWEKTKPQCILNDKLVH